MATKDSFDAKYRLPADEVAKSLESGLPGFDVNRARALGQLSQVRDAKSRSLSREQVLLARKRGGEHPRIAVAASQQTVNEQVRREVAIAREYSETPVPPSVPNTFVVHGFVRDRLDGAGVPGLTLALTDTKGTWQRQFGFACTDARGYFRLDIKSERPPTENPPGTPLGGGDGATETRLQLRVYDRQSRVLHTEKRPVSVRDGSVDFRLIALDDTGDRGCIPPSGQTDLPPPPVEVPKPVPGPSPTLTPTPTPTPGPRPGPNRPPRVPTSVAAIPPHPHVAGMKSFSQPASPAKSAAPKPTGKKRAPRAARKAPKRKP